MRPSKGFTEALRAFATQTLLFGSHKKVLAMIFVCFNQFNTWPLKIQTHRPVVLQ